jgi:uncharacterized protein
VSSTRLLVLAHPALWPRAGALAAPLLAACVRDTVAAAGSGGRDVVVLDRAPGEDETVVEVVAGALAGSAGPAVILGPTTPQLTPALVREAVEAVEDPWHEAVVGLTDEEGFWGLGLARWDPMALAGLPLGADQAGRYLLDRLHGLGLMVGLLPRLLEVRDLATARTLAPDLPGSSLEGAV